MDSYQFNDLKIEKNKIHNFLNSIEPKEYLTKELLSLYQSSPYYNNQGMAPANSWNANFGKILKQCHKDEIGRQYIQEIQSRVSTRDANNNPTTNSRWKVFKIQESL